MRKPGSESHWIPDTSAELRDITLGELLREVAAEVPDRMALVEGVPGERRRWTYASLLRASERVAAALLERFSQGERLVVYAPNCPEWILLQHAASLAGLVLVPINPAYKLRETEIIARTCRASGIFFVPRFRDNDTAAIVDRLESEVDHLRAAIELGQVGEWAQAVSPATSLPEVTPLDTLQVQFTSGTTGVPKGALLHHKGVINSAHYVAERAGFPDAGVWINAMPMFHIAGASVTRIGCLSHRGTYVLAPGFDPGSMLELIDSERGNATLIVPTMILAMLQHEDLARRDLSSLITVLTGAADVPAALIHRAQTQFGCGFMILYGQTEINGTVSTTRREDSVEDQTTTVGLPLPHAELKITDAAGATVPLGHDGEICVRGFQIMAGYDHAEEATASVIDSEGWMHTGDLGTMDARGYLKITGRLKDMIIRGGMNLYPREIEDLLFTHPGIAQVSVIGLPDETWGETVAAVVIPADPVRPPVTDELEEFCRERLSRHKVPRRWFFVDGFPLTPSGKVQKFRLRELAIQKAIPEVRSPARK